MWVHDLGDADAACGGKAVGLARLIAAGLPVPAGFAIEHRAFVDVAGVVDVRDEGTIGHVLAEAAQRIATAEIPPALEREVRERAAQLGVIVVRSSATIEDGEAGAAAGVFSSRRAVPAADVWDAIRAVWTSALTPLAAAYARRRGGTIAIGVIVQRFVDGELATVYTRAPGAPEDDAVLVQRAGELERATRASADPRVVLALRAEAAIAAGRGADVELVVPHAARGEAAIAPPGAPDVELVVPHAARGGGEAAHAGAWIVQARPIVHPVATPRVPAPPAVLAPLVADGRRWTWDIAHNPDPLSTAQAELVARVEAAQIAPWSLRVCAGFLYTTQRAPTTTAPTTTAPTTTTTAPTATTAPTSGSPPPSAIRDPAELAREVARIEGELARVLEPAATSVPDAIARYLRFYEIWATELGPLIAHARAATTAAHTHASARPSSVEATLAAAAHGAITEAEVLARLGPLSPAWDVAVPTFGERPGLLRDAIARAATLGVRVPTSAGAAELTTAELAADLAERDDLWFARAQWLVRRALLARADELGVAHDDVCWLPFAALEPIATEHGMTGIDPDHAHRRAAAARAAAARAARWTMPVVVGGPPLPTTAPLRGVGTGTRVTGRVVRFASLASAVTVGAGDVVVTRAVTPALAVLVIGCAALVSETGGLLDHGAALARELGIPCVVGCHDAWSLLADGMLVTVDGAAGTVDRNAGTD